MNPSEPQRELLLRLLDGRLPESERPGVLEWLRKDPAARAFLREMAEQSVMVAELHRIALGRQDELHPRPVAPAQPERTRVAVRLASWRWKLAAAAVISTLAVIGSYWFSSPDAGIVRVAKVTGSSQYFGAKGSVENALKPGTVLRAGDTLETRSCDAWIEMALRDGSTLTIAGHSTLRLLDGGGGRTRFKLLQGSLWGDPGPGPMKDRVLIQTPTVAAELSGAQFNLQTSVTETMLRINDGSARVRQNLDGSEVEVSKGLQVASALDRKAPLSVTAQPEPISHWACDLWRVPEVILGKWLPPTENERARLGADPLLWPIPGHEPLMLYAVALAAWKSSEHPVLLRSDSQLRFRGRTAQAQTVRFGFSAQKVRGVFAGKFEVDIPASSLGPAGEPWEVALPLASFKPLHPQLSSSPDGLELTDIYALTVQDDAGLEIHHIELVPRQEPAAP